MRYIMGGADIEQVDFSNLEINNLLNNEVVTTDGQTTSYVFPKAGLKGRLLIRGVALTDASITFKLQEKQNGAWADVPNGFIGNLLADGNLNYIFKIEKWTEIRVAYTVVDTGDPGGAVTSTLTIDLFV